MEELEGRLVPATFTVTTPLDVVNPHDGRLSLREAISRANHHAGADTIVLPAGVFRISMAGSDDANAAGDFDVTDTVTIRGAGAARTALDGQRLDRVLDVLGTAPHSIKVTLQGLTVRNGQADAAGGGGVRVGNADLVLQNCAVIGNRTTGFGGGISNATLPGTGDVTVIRCFVNHNAAQRGGGISVRANSQNQGGLLTVSGSMIGGNIAVIGGGIRASQASLTSTTVSGNSATEGCGGVEARTVTLTGSAVVNNVARTDGGGISAGTATLTHCLVRGNHAGGEGGGLSVGGVTLTDCTVSGNSAALRGGGMQGGAVTLIGSTVSGNSGSYGGGIQADTVTLNRSTLRGNFAGDGGGIGAATVTLTGSTVSGNTATTGDAGGIFAGDLVTLINSTVSGNTAAQFGGGVSAGRTAMLTNSTVSGNSATVAGGLLASTATMTGCTVSGNSARDGAGIFGSTVNLTNCTVSGNTASGRGGGISAVGITLLNVTVTDNSAHTGGGVLLGDGGSSSVRNSIIAGNSVDPTGAGPDVSGAFTSGGHNLIGDGTGSTGFANGVKGDMVGTAANPLDPRLGPLANNGGPTMTHALLAGSPAIDKGDNADVPATDQRGPGFARVKDGNGDRLAVVDIGAFER